MKKQRTITQPIPPGASWKNATVQLTEERQAGAPAEWPGFMLCYLDFASQRPDGSPVDPALDAQYDAASSINSVVVFGR